MLIIDEERVINALGVVPGLARVGREWPKLSERLPCVTVSQTGNAHKDYRDGAPYLDAVEMDVRVFAVKALEIEALAPELDAAMEGLGYTRILFYKDDNPECRMLLMRYRQYFARAPQ